MMQTSIVHIQLKSWRGVVVYILGKKEKSNRFIRGLIDATL